VIRKEIKDQSEIGIEVIAKSKRPRKLLCPGLFTFMAEREGNECELALQL